jgi:hypothetical protein
MMGRLKLDQAQLFYSFCIEEVVPDDYLVRQIASVLDLSWVHAYRGKKADQAASVEGAYGFSRTRFQIQPMKVITRKG